VHEITTIRKPRKMRYWTPSLVQDFNQFLTYDVLETGVTPWCAWDRDEIGHTVKESIGYEMRRHLRRVSNIYEQRKQMKKFNRPFVAVHVGRFGYGLV
jgi:hypothetical protein